MRPDERSAVDDRLAALKSVLERVPAPPLTAETATADSTAQPPARKRPAVPTNRRPAWPAAVGIAASVAIAVLAFMRPWSMVERPPEAAPATATIPAGVRGDYLAAPILVPIAVQSVTRGPELHYVDAQIVRDRHGNTGVVFVGSIREE